MIFGLFYPKYTPAFDMETTCVSFLGKVDYCDVWDERHRQFLYPFLTEHYSECFGGKGAL